MGSAPAGSPARLRSLACRCRQATCGASACGPADGLPQLFGNDPEFFVLSDEPLGLRLLEPSPPARYADPGGCVDLLPAATKTPSGS